MYLNNFTRESVMAKIKEYNDGSRAVGAHSCEYLTDSGNRCAVGCFIPDGHEALSYEGDASDLLHCYEDLADDMPLNIKQLQTLQNVHDRYDREDGIEKYSLHDTLENKLIELEKNYEI